MLGTEAGKKEVMIVLVQRNTVNCLSDVTGSNFVSESSIWNTPPINLQNSIAVRVGLFGSY